MTKYKTFYKRNLPHFQPLGYAFFVTFRLHGSLPNEIITKLKLEREMQLKYISGINSLRKKTEEYKIYQNNYFKQFDKLLDRSSIGPKWLKDEKVAIIINEEIRIRDGIEYNLIAYTIMPNHVHLVFVPIEKFVARSEASRELENEKQNGKRSSASLYIVTKILQDLKSKTALKCNKILNRSGAFWQHESYDHVVRNNQELRRIVEYVLNNPVKAGLTEKWDNWKWSYYNPDYLL